MYKNQEKIDCNSKKCILEKLFKKGNNSELIIAEILNKFKSFFHFNLYKIGGDLYRKGSDALTCVGDPYTNHGVKCVPIEGLFIGKK